MTFIVLPILAGFPDLSFSTFSAFQGLREYSPDCLLTLLPSHKYTVLRPNRHLFCVNRHLRSPKRDDSCCDPDCLVQTPNSRIAPQSIGEGASSLFGGWPGCNPRLAPVQPWGCSRARDIFGTPWRSPKKTTCSFSYRFRGNPGIRGLYQAVRVARLLSKDPCLQ